MRAFGPCVVVMLVGVAMMLGSGFVLVTQGETRIRSASTAPLFATIRIPPANTDPVPVSLSADGIPLAVPGGRGGEAS